MKFFCKAIIYRLLSFGIQFGLLYFLTGKIDKAFSFSIVIEASKTVWYYIYELIFNRIWK